MMTHRYFIYMTFDGTRYHGWQVQPNGISVQEVLEKALSTLLRKKTEVVGAGRTDAGVHAMMMVAHFDEERELDCSQLHYKLNRLLPRDVAVNDVREVSPQLHARFSAVRRTYHYYIHCRKLPFCQGQSAELHYPLDFGKMNEAAKVLLATSDFASFCKSNHDAKTTLCDVVEAHWDCVGDSRWCFTISANRFLRNMVRAVVGTLLDVGRGKCSLEEFRQIVASGKRTEAGESVPACGLYLWDVQYPRDADSTPGTDSDEETND